MKRCFSSGRLLRPVAVGILLVALIPTCLVASNDSPELATTSNLHGGVSVDGEGVETPTFSVRPRAVRFSGLMGSSPQQENLQIEVASGTVSYRVSVTILNGTGWLIATPPSGTASPGLPSTIRLDVKFAAFSEPGTYQAEVVILDEAGAVLTKVPVVVVARQEGPELQLSQSAIIFRTIAGRSVSPQTLRITNSGQGNLNWTIPPI